MNLHYSAKTYFSFFCSLPSLTCNKPPQGPPTMLVHGAVQGHCTEFHSLDRPVGALDPLGGTC